MKIAVIPGDGIGREVISATLHILQNLDLPFEYVYAEAGDECMRKFGVPLPDETLEICRESDAILFGAVGETAADVIVRLRQELDLFANVRPAKSIRGVNCLYDVDIVVVRENTECLYKGYEFEVGDSAVAMRVITRRGCERIIRFAFEFARREGRKRVTALHKANVLKKTCGLFKNVFYEIAKNYEFDVNDYYIDAGCLYLVTKPWIFDVIVTTNLFGDIVSDLTAGLVGGLGLAPSANIGERYALFEPVHGSAPDIAGKGIANPSATILSACMMLRHLGFGEVAEKVERALENVISEGKTTPDLGGNLKTMEFAEEVLKNIG
ncbi:MAG: NAD-dependent isocitrate dehydrogenase [Archaeoglobales archaeon]|nr:MAG: NAD-dependent isocitrate dehydrogenase [Archaeoglobales archaeon]